MTNGPGNHTAMLRSALKRALILAPILPALGADAREALLLGGPAVAAATWLSLRLLPPQRPLRVLRFLTLLPGFLWRSLLGGVDVAWRAFHPRMPLNPGWASVPSQLPDGGKVALGAEFSLMPGTLVAGTREGKLLVHMLDADQHLEGAVRLEEARIARMLGRADAAPAAPRSSESSPGTGVGGKRPDTGAGGKPPDAGAGSA